MPTHHCMAMPCPLCMGAPTVTTTTMGTLAWPVTYTASAPLSPEKFVEWLRGFLDGVGDKLGPEQVKKIREKLGAETVPMSTDLGELVKKLQPTEPCIPPMYPYVPPTVPQKTWPEWLNPFEIWCTADNGANAACAAPMHPGTVWIGETKPDAETLLKFGNVAANAACAAPMNPGVTYSTTFCANPSADWFSVKAQA